MKRSAPGPRSLEAATTAGTGRHLWADRAGVIDSGITAGVLDDAGFTDVVRYRRISRRPSTEAVCDHLTTARSDLSR